MDPRWVIVFCTIVLVLGFGIVIFAILRYGGTYKITPPTPKGIDNPATFW